MELYDLSELVCHQFLFLAGLQGFHGSFDVCLWTYFLQSHLRLLPVRAQNVCLLTLCYWNPGWKPDLLPKHTDDGGSWMALNLPSDLSCRVPIRLYGSSVHPRTRKRKV